MIRTPRLVVAHTVFPVSDVADVLPLYVDGDSSAATVLGRTSVRVGAGQSISLGSYFNSFPAAHWRAESDRQAVVVDVRAAGTGAISVMRSDAEGRTREVRRIRVDGQTHAGVDLPLADFDQGGAYWLDLTAGAEDMTLEAAEWSVEGSATATASVAMATFNRPAACVHQLNLLADPVLGDVIDRVIVVDQGEELVADQPAFDSAARALSERLVLIRQANLGGSGGFSRGMAEILDRRESTFVIVLDDDAICEPEALFRAVRFADVAKHPLIVGGGMLHLDDRSVLYTQSERWNRRTGWVDLSRSEAYDHDFARDDFRQSPYFHRRHESDFNGWWMCLIPVTLLRERGLAMPLFLKGDDVEFALRAHAHQVRTISIPGIAAWHLGWGGKVPTRTWEAYFLHRNRMITNLLHASRRHAAFIVGHSLLGDIKLLLSAQYGAVLLRAQALDDAMAGPDRLYDWLPTRAAQVRQSWSEFPEVAVESVDAPVRVRAAAGPPESRLARVLLLARAVARQVVPPVRTRRSRQDIVAEADLGWWTFARTDEVRVASPGREGVSRYSRSPRRAREALARSLRAHGKLLWRWSPLAGAFRAKSRELTKPETWAAAFRR